MSTAYTDPEIGYFPFGYVFSELEFYFQKPDAQRFLLLEILRKNASQTTYYLSDAPYTTSPSDTPANLQYSPVIGGTGLPGIRRTLNDPFEGSASTGFGSITLIDRNVSTSEGVDRFESQIQTPRGAVVSAYLSGPLSLFPRSSAMPLLTGTVARSGGSSEGDVTFEITDGAEFIRNKTVNAQDFPLSFGLVRNISPKLINPAQRIYAVHDSRIQSIDAVYDNGVLLNPSQYSVDLLNGQFTLNQNPIGVLTADVKGAVVNSVWLQSTEDITRELLRRSNINSTQVYSLPIGLIGLYLNANELLGSILDRLMTGVAGYWLIDDLVFTAAQFPIPNSSGSIAIFTENEIIDEVTYEDDDRLYKQINYSYRNNYTLYQSAPGASAAQATFSQLEYLQGNVQDGSPIAELEYQDSPEINTLFDQANDAASVANRVLSIYRTPRKRLKLTVPFTSSLKLGDNIFISFSSLEFTGAIVSIVDIFDGSYPVQELEVLA